jgi:hypothetical protein
LLTANAGSLRQLHLDCVAEFDFDVSFAHAARPSRPSHDGWSIVAPAPRLQVLTAEFVSCVWEDAPRMLRAEPPFALLQMRRTLSLYCETDVGGMNHVCPSLAALADAALQPELSELDVWAADTAELALMGALADAVLARRLRKLKLEECTAPAAAPLARLLAEGSLDAFHFGPLCDNGMPLFDAADAALVADALRVNTTLTELVLFRAGLGIDMRGSQLLLGGLVGHPSLRELLIVGDAQDNWDDTELLGAALAALIAADAPTLQVLVCRDLDLGDLGLTPVVEALPLNRHLCGLDMGDNRMSEAFARERLLPALRANTTLRELICANYESRPTAVEAEAEELVRWLRY